MVHLSSPSMNIAPPFPDDSMSDISTLFSSVPSMLSVHPLFTVAFTTAPSPSESVRWLNVQQLMEAVLHVRSNNDRERVIVSVGVMERVFRITLPERALIREFSKVVDSAKLNEMNWNVTTAGVSGDDEETEKTESDFRIVERNLWMGEGRSSCDSIFGPMVSYWLIMAVFHEVKSKRRLADSAKHISEKLEETRALETICMSKLPIYVHAYLLLIKHRLFFTSIILARQIENVRNFKNLIKKITNILFFTIMRYLGNS